MISVGAEMRPFKFPPFIKKGGISSDGPVVKADAIASVFLFLCLYFYISFAKNNALRRVVAMGFKHPEPGVTNSGKNPTDWLECREYIE